MSDIPSLIIIAGVVAGLVILLILVLKVHHGQKRVQRRIDNLHQINAERQMHIREELHKLRTVLRNDMKSLEDSLPKTISSMHEQVVNPLARGFGRMNERLNAIEMILPELGEKIAAAAAPTPLPSAPLPPPTASMVASSMAEQLEPERAGHEVPHKGKRRSNPFAEPPT